MNETVLTAASAIEQIVKELEGAALWRVVQVRNSLFRDDVAFVVGESEAKVFPYEQILEWVRDAGIVFAHSDEGEDIGLPLCYELNGERSKMHFQDEREACIHAFQHHYLCCGL